MIPASASSGIQMGASTHIHEYGNWPPIFGSANMPDNSRRINEQSMLIFNSTLRVESERVELFLRVQLLSEHAVLFDWFDHIAHVMRVIGDGLALVGDADDAHCRLSFPTSPQISSTGVVCCISMYTSAMQ